ncbi:MAG TPA: haloacid dehalogenase type II [Hyphomicrobiaceae bacterium]|nr:haloacid dehalogenase type II [Hyphomicrobiaceae bacterium]
MPMPVGKTPVNELKNSLKILTFDLYGTVVDMQQGLTEMVTPYLREKGWQGKPTAFVTWWRRTHFENSMIDALLNRGHTPYREIGRRAVTLTLERAGIPHTQEEVRRLVAAIEKLRPFDDAPDALARLSKHYRIALLSNGDPDMLENAKPHIGYKFDAYISIAACGYFKPHFATYQKAADILGAEIGTIMHVANHAFDCIGAQAQGMRGGFINRRQRPYEDTPYQPDLVVGTLKELADVMA